MVFIGLMITLVKIQALDNRKISGFYRCGFVKDFGKR